MEDVSKKSRITIINLDVPCSWGKDLQIGIFTTPTHQNTDNTTGDSIIFLPDLPWGQTSARGKQPKRHICKEVDIFGPKFVLLVSKCRIPEDVRSIDISCMDFKGFEDPNKFSDMINLTTIISSWNELPMEAFSGLYALQSLTLVHNNIQRLPLFRERQRRRQETLIEVGRVRGGEITRFAVLCRKHTLLEHMAIVSQIRGPLSGFTQLRTLDLSLNPLDWRSLSFVSQLPHLEEVRLRGCGLRCLPRSWTTGGRFPALRRLDLTDNALRSPRCFLVLSCLPHLQELLLDGNEFEAVPCLLRWDEVTLLDLITRKQSDQIVPRKKRCTCYLTAFEMGLLDEDPSEECFCFACRPGRPSPECGCRQSVGEDAVCTQSDKSSMSQSLPRIQLLIKYLAASSNGLSYLGDGEKGIQGSLHGVPMFPVRHQPFSELVVLSLRRNKIKLSYNAFSPIAWPCVRRFILTKNSLFDREIDKLYEVFGNIVDMKEIQNNVPESPSEFFVMEQPGFEFLYSEHVVRHEEPGEDSEVNLPKKSSDEIVWGSWWSDSSSTTEVSTGEDPQNIAIALVQRYWDKVWQTKRPPPPPPVHQHCVPGVFCFRHKDKHFPEPPPVVPKKKSQTSCSAEAPCTRATRQALYQIVWGSLLRTGPTACVRISQSRQRNIKQGKIMNGSHHTSGLYGVC